MASQMGSKGIMGDSGNSQLAEKKTMGEHIFSRIGAHNRPHEFNITPRPTAPKFLIPKEETNIQFEIDTITKEWAKLDQECRRSIKFEQYFTMEKKLKNKEDNKSLHQNKEYNCAIGKFSLHTFDGSYQSSANTWVQKLGCVFLVQSNGGRRCFKNWLF